MSQTLRNIQKSRQGNTDDNRNTANVVPFPAMLAQFKGEIARALPKHLNPDRMTRTALTAFRLNPKLSETDPRSVFAAVIQACQLGLEVGLMGEAYLVPFGSQCQLIPGYQGLMKLARNSGFVQDIYAQLIAVDVAYTYFTSLSKTLREALRNESGKGGPDAVAAAEKILGRLNEIEQEARDMLRAEYLKGMQVAEMGRSLQLLDQSLNSGMPTNIFQSMMVFNR